MALTEADIAEAIERLSSTYTTVNPPEALATLFTTIASTLAGSAWLANFLEETHQDIQQIIDFTNAVQDDLPDEDERLTSILMTCLKVQANLTPPIRTTEETDA